MAVHTTSLGFDIFARNRAGKTLRRVAGDIDKLNGRMKNVSNVAAIAGLAGATVKLSAALAPAVGSLTALPGLAAAAGVAFAGLSLGLKKVGTVLNASMTGWAEMYHGVLKGMDKDAKKVVKRIGDTFWKLQDKVQNAFFKPMLKASKGFKKDFRKRLIDGLSDVADSWGRIGADLFKFSRTEQSLRFMDKLFKTVGKTIDGIRPGIKPLIQGIMDLTAMFFPELEAGGKVLGKLLKKWGKWMSLIANSDQASNWWERAKQVIASLWNISVNLLSVFNSLFKASDSDNLLKTIEGITEEMAKWSKSKEGQEELRSTLMALGEVAEALIVLLPMLGSVLTTIASIFNSMPAPVRTVVASILAFSIITSRLGNVLSGTIGVIGRLIGVSKALGSKVFGGKNKKAVDQMSESYQKLNREMDKAPWASSKGKGGTGLTGMSIAPGETASLKDKKKFEKLGKQAGTATKNGFASSMPTGGAVIPTAVTTVDKDKKKRFSKFGKKVGNIIGKGMMGVIIALPIVDEITKSVTGDSFADQLKEFADKVKEETPKKKQKQDVYKKTQTLDFSFSVGWDSLTGWLEKQRQKIVADWGWLTGVISGYFDGWLDGIKKGWQGIVDWWNQGIAYFEELLGYAGDFFSSVGSAIGNFFTVTVPSWWTTFTTWVSSVWTAFTTWVSSVWTGIKNAIVGRVRSVYIGLVTWIGLAKKWVVDKFIALALAVKLWWTTIKNKIVGTAKGIWLAVKLWFGSIKVTIVRIVTTVGGWIKDKFNAIKDGAVNAFKKMKDGIGTAFSAIKNLAKKPINFVIGTVYNDGIRALWNKIAPVVGASKLDKVAKLATGGPVKGPGTGTSDSIPARLSNGEHVWTAREVRAAGGHNAVASIRSMILGGRTVRATAGMGNGGAPTMFKDGGGWIANAFGSVKDGITGLAKDAWDGLSDVARGGIYPVAEKILNPLKNTIKDRIPSKPLMSGLMRKTALSPVEKVLAWIQADDDKFAGGAGFGDYKAMTKWIKARVPGTRISSDYRAGDPGYHGKKQAIDMVFSDGSERRGWREGKAKTAFTTIKNAWKKDIRELIWDPAKGRAVWNGKNHFFTGAGAGPGTHNDHIHWAMPKAEKYPGGKGVARWASTVKSVLHELGLYSSSNLKHVMNAIRTESGGNPKAVNNWDANARRGTPSKGLLQTIGPTFNAYAGKYKSRGVFDPRANIYAAIRYAKSRYGKGWASRMDAAPGVGYAMGGGVTPLSFDNGGLLPEGISLVHNGTGKPEPVGHDLARGDSYTFNITVEGGGNMTEREFQTALVKAVTELNRKGRMPKVKAK